MDYNIKLEEFEFAYNKIKKFYKETPLLLFKDNIFLKKESLQFTGSFKWSGVLYSVMKTFDEIVIHKTSPFYLVTQSTGNHGIAVIASVTLMIEYYNKLYPEYKYIFENISPCIFANKNIKINKLKKMKEYLKKFKFNDNGFIDNSFANYKQSLIARTEFLKKKNGKYLEHGGKDIMMGYGAIAFSIDKQLQKNKSISFFSAVGAGGPIGIGLCLSLLRKTEINICQTNGFDAFIKSLYDKNNNIIENKEKSIPDVSDGIAVDKPEIFSLEIAKKIVKNGIIVDIEKVKNLVKITKLGGSSCIALEGINIYKPNTDVIIILDCEGNE